MSVSSTDPSYCGIFKMRLNDSSGTEPTPFEMELRLSFLFYNIIASRPGVAVGLLLISGLAILFNVAVIVWRCSSNRSPHSILVINLALSDILLSLGRILLVAVMKRRKNWCAYVSLLMARLCWTSRVIANAAIFLWAMLYVTIIFLGFMQIVGCCGRRISAGKRSLGILLVVEWLISFALSTSGELHSYTYNQLLHESHNISIGLAKCGTFFQFGEYPSHRLGQVITDSSYFFVAIAMTSFYIATVVFVCRKLRDNRQIRNQEGIRLMTAIFLVSIPLLLFTSLNAYLMANSKRGFEISKSVSFQDFFAATMFVPSIVSFFGPFIYTFSTSVFRRRLKILCTSRKCCKKDNNGFAALENPAATSSTSAWTGDSDDTNFN